MIKKKKRPSKESYQSDDAFKSKYSFLDQKKLDDLYLTNLMRELWSVPISKFDEYLENFYPNPTAMEQIEINDLRNIIKKAKRRAPLSDDEHKVMQYKHTRMYGKPRQLVELSGRDGEAIELSSLNDSELQKEMKNKIDKIKEALSKLKDE